MASLLERHKLVAVLVLAALVVLAGNQLSSILRLDYYSTGAHTSNIFAYQQSGLRADVLLLGSSHIRRGVIVNQLVELLATDGLPGIEAFSLSQSGSTVLTTQIALRDLIESNGCPALVMVEVSPGSLNEGRDWEDMLIGRPGLAELPILFPEFSKAGRLNSFMASQLRGLHRLFDRLASPPEPELVEGAFERRGSLNPVERAGTRPGNVLSAAEVIRGREVYRRKHWADFAISALQTRALQRILSLAEECSAGVLLVRMPNLGMHHPRDIEKIETVYNAFMESFVTRNDLPYVNLQRADLGLRRGHFEDAGHLNPFGASIVTRHLTTEWLVPILLQHPSRRLVGVLR